MLKYTVKSCPKSCLRTCSACGRNSILYSYCSQFYNGLAKSFPGCQVTIRKSSTGSVDKTDCPRCTPKFRVTIRKNSNESKDKMHALRKFIGRQGKVPCRKSVLSGLDGAEGTFQPTDSDSEQTRHTHEMLIELRKLKEQCQHFVKRQPDMASADIEKLRLEATAIVELCQQLNEHRAKERMQKEMSKKRVQSMTISFPISVRLARAKALISRAADRYHQQSNDSGLEQRLRSKLVKMALTKHRTISLNTASKNRRTQFREMSQKANLASKSRGDEERQLRMICQKMAQQDECVILTGNKTEAMELEELAKLCNAMIKLQSDKLASEEKEIKQLIALARECEEIAVSQKQKITNEAMEKKVIEELQELANLCNNLADKRDIKKQAEDEEEKKKAYKYMETCQKEEKSGGKKGSGKDCSKGKEGKEKERKKKCKEFAEKEECEKLITAEKENAKCKELAEKDKCEKLMKAEKENAKCKELAEKDKCEKLMKAEKNDEAKCKELAEKDKCEKLMKAEKENAKCKELAEKDKCEKLMKAEKENAKCKELAEKDKCEKLMKAEISEKALCKALAEKDKCEKIKKAEKRKEKAKCRELADKDKCEKIIKAEKDKKQKKKCKEAAQKEKCEKLAQREKCTKSDKGGEKKKSKSKKRKERGEENDEGQGKKCKKMAEKAKCDELAHQEKCKEMAQKKRCAELAEKEMCRKLAKKEKQRKEDERNACKPKSKKQLLKERILKRREEMREKCKELKLKEQCRKLAEEMRCQKEQAERENPDGCKKKNDDLGALEKLKENCKILARKAKASCINEASSDADKSEKCMEEAEKKSCVSFEMQCEEGHENEKRAKENSQKAHSGNEKSGSTKSGAKTGNKDESCEDESLEEKCEELSQKQKEAKKLGDEMRRVQMAAQKRMCAQLAEEDEEERQRAERACLIIKCQELAEKERCEKLAREAKLIEQAKKCIAMEEKKFKKKKNNGDDCDEADAEKNNEESCKTEKASDGDCNGESLEGQCEKLAKRIKEAKELEEQMLKSQEVAQKKICAQLAELDEEERKEKEREMIIKQCRKLKEKLKCKKLAEAEKKRKAAAKCKELAECPKKKNANCEDDEEDKKEREMCKKMALNEKCKKLKEKKKQAQKQTQKQPETPINEANVEAPKPNNRPEYQNKPQPDPNDKYTAAELKERCKKMATEHYQKMKKMCVRAVTSDTDREKRREEGKKLKQECERMARQKDD